MKFFVKRIDLFLKDNIFSIVLFAFFLLDAVNFFIDRYSSIDAIGSATIFFKGVVFGGAVLLLVLKKEKLMLPISVLIVLPAIGILLDGHGVQDLTIGTFLQASKMGYKYVFAAVLYLVLEKHKEINKKRLFSLFEFIYLFSSIIVVLSFLFGWSFFYTYNQHRFGFKPLVASQNEASLFWIIGIVYFVTKGIIEQKGVVYLKGALVVIGGVLLGTKSVWLFLVVMSLLSFRYFKNIKYRFASVAVPVTLGILFIYSGSYDFWLELIKKFGFLNAASSYRFDMLKGSIEYITENWRWYNFLIGDVNSIRGMTEMDIVDLFLFGGGGGVVLFLYVLTRTLFCDMKYNLISRVLFFSIIIIGSMAGHFFYSGVCAIYLAVLCCYLQQIRDNLRVMRLGLL